ncbi:MAG: TIGR04086 family membrane protein [Clostridia bacterium]|jgi:putative membrane protein (TIGR04086 family)|nr:TIGR04086 family membrane protein [Clostridia bacterium]
MSGTDKLEIKAIWLGVTVALGCWFVSGIMALLWVVFTEAQVYHWEFLIYLLGLAGVLVGGVVAGRIAEEKGWFHGLWVGILLGLLGIIINLELVPELYSWVTLGRQLLVWSLWGLAGGYVGAHFLTRARQMSKIKGIRKKLKKGSRSL